MERYKVLNRLDLINKIAETLLFLCLFAIGVGVLMLNEEVRSIFSDLVLYLLALSILFLTLTNIAKLFFSRRVFKNKTSAKIHKQKKSLSILVNSIALVVVLFYVSLIVTGYVGVTESVFGKLFIVTFVGLIWYLLISEYKKEV